MCSMRTGTEMANPCIICQKFREDFPHLFLKSMFSISTKTSMNCCPFGEENSSHFNIQHKSRWLIIPCYRDFFSFILFKSYICRVLLKGVVMKSEMKSIQNWNFITPWNLWNEMEFQFGGPEWNSPLYNRNK